MPSCWNTCPECLKDMEDCTCLGHKNIGSSFDDFLEEEGILEEVEKTAKERIENHAYIINKCKWYGGDCGDCFSNPTPPECFEPFEEDSLMKKEEVRSKLKEVLEEGDLDEDVHDLKSKEASRINNSGFDAQMDYLESQGIDLYSLYVIMRERT